MKDQVAAVSFSLRAKNCFDVLKRYLMGMLGGYVFVLILLPSIFIEPAWRLRRDILAAFKLDDCSVERQGMMFIWMCSLIVLIFVLLGILLGLAR